MGTRVKTLTPDGAPKPIGPYNHIAMVDDSITIGGLAGIDPATGALAGDTVQAQTAQILDNFAFLLGSVGSDLSHVLHVNIFLLRMADFEEMNRAYEAGMGSHRPARTVFGVNELPKPGFLLTMNLTAARR